ncbi:hypothetical protein KC343_g61 [Hortaea werneckii]|nr:hypothetical protein KC317_g59 [Hortaea werneckii]KAI7628680.1 hypothetical protein KC346_g63 [Hortaea werneckii]KAI7638477.1 hypothetical protein KC343_g61 [Hortaea werneckii]
MSSLSIKQGTKERPILRPSNHQSTHHPLPMGKTVYILIYPADTVALSTKPHTWNREPIPEKLTRAWVRLNPRVEMGKRFRTPVPGFRSHTTYRQRSAVSEQQRQISLDLDLEKINNFFFAILFAFPFYRAEVGCYVRSSGKMVCASSLIPLRASVSLVTSMKTLMAAEVSFKTSRHKHLDRVVWEDPCLDVHLSLDGYKVSSEKSFFFKFPSRTVLKCTHSGKTPYLPSFLALGDGTSTFRGALLYWMIGQTISIRMSMRPRVPKPHLSPPRNQKPVQENPPSPQKASRSSCHLLPHLTIGTPKTLIKPRPIPGSSPILLLRTMSTLPAHLGLHLLPPIPPHLERDHTLRQVGIAQAREALQYILPRALELQLGVVRPLADVLAIGGVDEGTAVQNVGSRLQVVRLLRRRRLARFVLDEVLAVGAKLEATHHDVVESGLVSLAEDDAQGFAAEEVDRVVVGDDVRWCAWTMSRRSWRHVTSPAARGWALRHLLDPWRWKSEENVHLYVCSKLALTFVDSIFVRSRDVFDEILTVNCVALGSVCFLCIQYVCIMLLGFGWNALLFVTLPLCTGIGSVAFMRCRSRLNDNAQNRHSILSVSSDPSSIAACIAFFFTDAPYPLMCLLYSMCAALVYRSKRMRVSVTGVEERGCQQAASRLHRDVNAHWPFGALRTRRWDMTYNTLLHSPFHRVRTSMSEIHACSFFGVSMASKQSTNKPTYYDIAGFVRSDRLLLMLIDANIALARHAISGDSGTFWPQYLNAEQKIPSFGWSAVRPCFSSYNIM